MVGEACEYAASATAKFEDRSGLRQIVFDLAFNQAHNITPVAHHGVVEGREDIVFGHEISMTRPALPKKCLCYNGCNLVDIL